MARRIRRLAPKPPVLVEAHKVDETMSEAERRSVFTAIAKHFLVYMDQIGCISYEDSHQIAYNLLDSIEARMRMLGLRIPTYTRRLKGTTKATEANFTLCKRCVLREWHEKKGAWVCPQTFVGPTKATACMFEPSEGDGCSRGIPSKEYRS